MAEEIHIKKLYTVHYFEFDKTYKFFGESHDFWEFVYVDKGEMMAVADDKEHLLKQGTVIFHKPNEWHTLIANGTTAPNIAIVSFACNSLAMEFFKNKVLAVGQEQKQLISKIIAEYTNAFVTPLDDPYTSILMRKTNGAFGAEQLLQMYLSELLISFLRSNQKSEQEMLPNINRANATLNMILNYMSENLSNNLTLKEIVTYCGMSKSAVNNLFQKQFHKGTIEYFIGMKIEMAKKYLREDNYNITQIADMLGYSNVHYFSRQFKQMTGMSPSEYALSIKAILLR